MQFSKIWEMLVREEVLRSDKSILSNDEQFLNKPSIFVTFDVMVFLKLNETKFVQFENIWEILVTDEILKLDKSILSAVQELNIKLISLTLEISKYKRLVLRYILLLLLSKIWLIFTSEEVLKFEKGILLNFSQPLKSPAIFLTFEVSILVKLIDVNWLQFRNIYSIFSTEEVLKCDKSKYSRLLQLPNIYLILVTLEVSKL